MTPDVGPNVVDAVATTAVSWRSLAFAPALRVVARLRTRPRGPYSGCPSSCLVNSSGHPSLVTLAFEVPAPERRFVVISCRSTPSRRIAPLLGLAFAASHPMFLHVSTPTTLERAALARGCQSPGLVPSSWFHSTSTAFSTRGFQRYCTPVPDEVRLVSPPHPLRRTDRLRPRRIIGCRTS